MTMDSGELLQFLEYMNPSELDVYLGDKEIEGDTPQVDHFELQPIAGNDQRPFDMSPDSSTKVTETKTSTGAMPSIEDYPGPFDFNFEISKSHGIKTKWVHSDTLNKLYLPMNSKVAVKFKWNQSELGLYIRALPVFLSEDDFAEPVQRCPTHASDLEVSNKGFPHVYHIIRCDSDQAIYSEDVDSKRLSVLAPLESPQPGSDCTTMVYSFMCKNSCYLGMNRRQTAVIFTLERPNSEVLGRKILNVRICSCPRRDMVKDETLKFESKPEPADDNSTCLKRKSNETKVKVKKQKLLSGDDKTFRIYAPKSYHKSLATVIKEVILLKQCQRALTPEENLILENCDSYLSLDPSS